MHEPHNPPPIPHRAGLGPAECSVCGARTLAAPGVEQPRCEACLRARVERSTGISADLPHVQDAVNGLTWLPITVVHQDAINWHEHDGATKTAEPMPPAVDKIKILELAHTVELDDERVPRAARLLAKRAAEYGRQVRLTCALAARADELVHSLCVRLWTAKDDAGRADRFGYAAYVNGQSSSCVLWRGQEGGPRKCGVTEFAALALGQPYQPPAPPPSGPCPACGRSVRWTKAGTWKHNRPDKTPCAGLQFS